MVPRTKCVLNKYMLKNKGIYKLMDEQMNS